MSFRVGVSRSILVEPTESIITIGMPRPRAPAYASFTGKPRVELRSTIVHEPESYPSAIGAAIANDRRLMKAELEFVASLI
jgi:hypothetical protein